MSDDRAREKYAELANGGNGALLGRSILRDARNHSVRSAQWQVDQSVKSAGRDGVSVEKLAVILAAREMAVNASASQEISNSAFRVKTEQIRSSPGFTALAEQYRKDPSMRNRINEGLTKGDGGKALEQEYRCKQNFLATASFSSLLFYERRSLRHGGFFLPSPWPDSMTRVDLLWAALADIACSTYEQLQRLIDLSGHQRDYVFGCGGGLRSGTLCQMIADLSGLELRLLPGFEQATLYGLTVLCNHACHVDTPAAEGSVLRYPPRSGDLIGRYHERWREERLSLNPPVSNN